MPFCKEKKSKEKALDSPTALRGELKGIKVTDYSVKKFHSPPNPEEGRTGTCKGQGANDPSMFLKVQVIFLKFVN